MHAVSINGPLIWYCSIVQYLRLEQLPILNSYFDTVKLGFYKRL